MGLLFVAPPVVLIGFFLLVPASRTIFQTLVVETGDGGTRFSLERYVAFFSDGYSLRNLTYTLSQTFITLFILIVINVPIALYLRFRTGRFSAGIQFLALFPMFVPGVIIAYALIQYLGPNGVLQSILEHVGFYGYRTPYLTSWGTIIGLVWDAMPFTLLVLIAGVARISNASIEAARDLGAGKLRILVSIILPQLYSSILIACSFNFFLLFSSVLQPFLLGPATPEMMGPFMLRTFAGLRDPATASVQATVTFLICSIAGYAYVRSMLKRNKAEGGR